MIVLLSFMRRKIFFIIKCEKLHEILGKIDQTFFSRISGIRPRSWAGWVSGYPENLVSGPSLMRARLTFGVSDMKSWKALLGIRGTTAL